MSSETDLLPTLRRYWGYDSFRPLQERIVRSLLSGNDTCVVMPTGGGKSLCYQLPAALSPGKTAVVVSPLIALMQDQVAQLSQMGIAAAVLNSSLAGGQQALVMRNASKGQYRLLYLSPERLAGVSAIEWLKSVPLSFFVIDEAHCISEWGHEFRPDYRQLSSLRAHFPECPIAAFTASATRRVRQDILDQLRLREPDKYIASFHRSNLRYVARQCDAKTQSGLLLKALRKYSDGNVIVYAPTIAKVEATVDFLEEKGIPAIGYHGKMDAGTRRRNQERWMSDEVRVLVGTLAFGLGINKAAVRAVIHLALPKSIEQFYQEAGRAGRDGLPADCIMLWQKRDSGLHAYFIGKITDPQEKGRAWQRYDEIQRFVNSKSCRHRQVCAHFGENTKWKSCGACDVCGYLPAWLAGKADELQPKTQRRKRRKSAPPPDSKVRGPWPGPAQKVLAPEVDSDLREYLREWRRAAAKQQGVPAFIVMHDTSLEELCRIRPRSLSELLQVSGFGERKTELYGSQILDALARFGSGSRAAVVTENKPRPAEETIQLLAEGRTFDEIAKIRGRQVASVVYMIAGLVERGEVSFQSSWVDSEKQERIEAACARLGLQRLNPLKEALPAEITFEEIRLVVARLRREQQSP